MAKLFQNVEVWSHGSKFIVRRVTYQRNDPRPSGWRLRRPYSHNMGKYVIFAPNGSFLCRVQKMQIKRWVSYYALLNLRESRWQKKSNTIGSI